MEGPGGGSRWNTTNHLAVLTFLTFLDRLKRVKKVDGVKKASSIEKVKITLIKGEPKGVVQKGVVGEPVTLGRHAVNGPPWRALSTEWFPSSQEVMPGPTRLLLMA